MAVLKDIACTRCETLSEAMWPVDRSCGIAPCASCGRATAHESRCTGGLKSRWRYADWSGYNATGAVTIGTPTAEYVSDDMSTETRVEHYRGGTCDMQPRFQNTDVRDERRDRRTHAAKQRAGKGRLAVDSKRATSARARGA